MRESSLGAVVVHHKNYPRVLDTIGDIVSAGIAPSRVVVVDNGGDPAVVAAIDSQSPDGVRVVAVENKGYAHAVNFGVRTLHELAPSLDFVLVATHETRFAGGVLEALCAALNSDPLAAVAGPLLVDETTGRVWSSGGYLTRFLMLPRHRHYSSDVSEIQATLRAPVLREWLDGAFCVYRLEALHHVPLDESYFLYFEEVDLHVRMARAGMRVICVPSATVTQSSAGIPPYLHGRNIVLFLAKNGTATARSLAPAWTFARNIARACFRRTSWAAVRDYRRGWRDGRRLARSHDLPSARPAY